MRSDLAIGEAILMGWTRDTVTELYANHRVIDLERERDRRRREQHDERRAAAALYPAGERRVRAWERSFRWGERPGDGNDAA